MLTILTYNVEVHWKFRFTVKTITQIIVTKFESLSSQNNKLSVTDAILRIL